MATPAQTAKLEAKAQAAETKSAGLRILFDEGYTVAEARTVMEVAYGFAYGVAKRAGVVDTAAERRGDGSKTAARKAKAAAAAPAPAAKAKPAPRAAAKAAPAATKTAARKGTSAASRK